MFPSRVLLIAICVGLCVGYPGRNHPIRSHKKPKPPAPRTEILLQKDYDKESIDKRLKAWTPADKQNIWELSGLLEGDIMMSSTHQASNKNGLLDVKSRWRDGIVPYYIIEDDFDEEQISVIMGAIQEYRNKTCLRFRPYKETDKDYITVQGSDSGCWSLVGRHQKGQLLNLMTPNCVRHGVVIHEFLHALGFYHQQSAADRDQWVTINWDNIQTGKEHNFKKYDDKTITDYGVQYDFGSIMHYSAYAFSKNDEPTIQPKVEDVKIGQRKGLSEKDVSKVQAMYKEHCEARQIKEEQIDYEIPNIWFYDTE